MIVFFLTNSPSEMILVEKKPLINHFRERVSNNGNGEEELLSKEDLVSSSDRDHELCAQMRSCLQFLGTTNPIDLHDSLQSMTRTLENGSKQVSREQSQKNEDETSSREVLPSHPLLRKSLGSHRSKRTIATFLLDDPLGLSVMDMAKGKEKALMLALPEVHRGSIHLKSVRSNSGKKLEAPVILWEGGCSTNNNYLKCNPLHIPLAVLKKSLILDKE